MRHYNPNISVSEDNNQLKEVLYNTEDDDMKHAYRAMGMGVATAVTEHNNGRSSNTLIYAAIDILAVHFLFDKDVVKEEAVKYGAFISNKVNVDAYTVESIFGINPYYTEHDIDSVKKHIEIYRLGIVGAHKTTIKALGMIKS